MSRNFGNPLTCGILAALFLLSLPLIPLLIAGAMIAQLLFGRQVIRLSRWYRRPAEPESPAPDESEPEIRASEAIIDAEVVELPDDPHTLSPSPALQGQQSGGMSASPKQYPPLDNF